MRDFVEPNLIFMTVAGSRMYGTDIATSDIDRRGVCVPPKNVVLGFHGKFEQQEYPNEDTTVYSLKKFMRLAADCNPNVIELLFAPGECVQVSHPVWKRLLQHRDEFLSAKAYVKFSGYAMGQLKRIRTHRSWLLNPIETEPTRADFGLDESGHGIRQASKGINLEKVSPELLAVVKKEQNYKSAHTAWSQFQNWKKNRNPNRSELEKQFGYDTKHAMHLVRLLRVGKEILTKGTITVRRPDAKELLDIRFGMWTYDQLMDYVGPMEEELKVIYKSGAFNVKAQVDVQKLSDLCCELHEAYWSGGNN